MAERIAPADATACARALAEASAAGRSVRVRGAGTNDHLGELRPTDLGLETSALSGVVEHVPADLTVTVRAGTPLATLQSVLGRAGQFLPLDVERPDRATCGGVIAANSGGFGRARYGGVRDLLIGLTVALADGTLARAGGRVVKNVAGYDLCKLYTGSFGTLGVIVEATHKVQPLPRASGIAGAEAPGVGAVLAAADALARTPLRPAALAIAHAAGGPWSILVRAQGDEPLVARTLADAARAFAANGAGPLAAGQAAALLEHAGRMVETARDGAIVRAALPRGELAAYLTGAAAVTGFAECAADASSGTVWVRVREEGAVAGIVGGLQADARGRGGWARVEWRGAGIGARLAAWDTVPPPGVELMRRLKALFDPVGILEPGRLPR